MCSSGELLPEATLSKMETVHREGSRPVRRTLQYYNLDMIMDMLAEPGATPVGHRA